MHNLTHILSRLFLFSTLVCFVQSSFAAPHLVDTIPPIEKVQHSILIEYYETADSTQQGQLAKILGQALDFYVDESIIWSDFDIEFKVSSNKMIKDLNQIVKDGVQFYDYKELSSFKGFSERVEFKIKELHAFDPEIYQLERIEDLNTRKDFIQTEIQSEVEELKDLLNMEIGNFTQKDILVLNKSELEGLDDETREKLLEEIKNFSQYDPLETIEVKLSDNSVAILNIKDETELVGAKEDLSFEDKVLKMLSENQEKLDDLENRMDNIEDNPNSISDNSTISEMIKEYLDDNSSFTTIENLPESVDIYFEKGSSKLSLANKLIVNEIIDILVREKNMGILVTGFADQIGNDTDNYTLSRNRAESVRNLALKSGVEDERILMNYFGESQSNGSNPGDRKVRIEFIEY